MKVIYKNVNIDNEKEVLEKVKVSLFAPSSEDNYFEIIFIKRWIISEIISDLGETNVDISSKLYSFLIKNIKYVGDGCFCFFDLNFYVRIIDNDDFDLVWYQNGLLYNLSDDPIGKYLLQFI